LLWLLWLLPRAARALRGRGSLRACCVEVAGGGVAGWRVPASSSVKGRVPVVSCSSASALSASASASVLWPSAGQVPAGPPSGVACCCCCCCKPGCCFFNRHGRIHLALCLTRPAVSAGRRSVQSCLLLLLLLQARLLLLLLRSSAAAVMAAAQ